MLLIRNAMLYTMEDGAVPQQGDILMDGGKIRAVGRDLPAQGAEVLDASGLTATPGLIDAHSHVGGFAMEGADLNEITDPVTAHLCAIDAIDIHCDAFKALHTFGITAASRAGMKIAALIDRRFSFDQSLAGFRMESLTEIPSIIQSLL